jgi:YVTN family beta-propeller protein
MDKTISKLLDNKYENLVQFNVVNTTQNPVLLDLFNTSEGLSTIPSSLTYIYPPNTIFNSFGTPIGLDTFYDLANNTITGDVYASFGSSNIQKYDSNGVLISTLNILGSISIRRINYNSNNNNLYACDNINGDVYVINCNTFTLVTTITTSFTGVFYSSFDSVNNNIYYSNNTPSIMSVNCNTNTSITISSTYIFNLDFVEYNSINNQIYIGTSVNSCVIYDIATSTFSAPILSFPTSTRTLNYNPLNNFMYVGSFSTSDVYVIDCNTNTIISTINIGGVLPFAFAFDYNLNNFYISSLTTDVALINCNSNTLINTITNTSASIGIVYSGINNSTYFVSQGTNDIQQITTIGVTATPYYISGSANYNAFVNNLNNEPIFIDEVRILTQNLTQLNNQVQFTKIDSNGNQIFFAEFPINKIDIEQNNNIAELKLNGLVFDGRTYINQYQLNAYESMSFEIYYKQLDLTTATDTFPIFFKPKVQLKEYIKKELNL